MIYHSDAMAITAEWAGQFDHLITDPPYSPHVHAKATSQSKGGGARHRDLGFTYLTPALRRKVATIAAAVRGWAVVYSDVEASSWMRISCQAAGARYIRTLPWIRWSMPQLTGTMPPQGFEHLLCFASKTGWNGPGNVTGLYHEIPDRLEETCLRGDEKHKAEKPLDQALEIISWFTSPGESVLDLFAGSGVFALACALLGRVYVGLDIDPAWVPRAQAREDPAQISDRDLERIKRWIMKEDDSAMTAPSMARQEKRSADRYRVLQSIT